MHAILLATLGPWSLDWNRVIWPWNVAMAIVLWLLAFRAQAGAVEKSGPLVRLVATSPFFWLIALVVALLPILNYFRLWDSHLSGSLYSGNNSEAIFFYDAGDSSHLPQGGRQFTYYYPGTREEFILIDNWAIGELEAPFYPEERYFRRVGAWMCGHLADTSKGGIRISVKEKFNSAETLKECRCGELH
jgi:hypothetical protein